MRGPRKFWGFRTPRPNRCSNQALCTGEHKMALECRNQTETRRTSGFQTQQLQIEIKSTNHSAAVGQISVWITQKVFHSINTFYRLSYWVVIQIQENKKLKHELENPEWNVSNGKKSFLNNIIRGMSIVRYLITTLKNKLLDVFAYVLILTLIEFFFFCVIKLRWLCLENSPIHAVLKIHEQIFDIWLLALS